MSDDYFTATEVAMVWAFFLGWMLVDHLRSR